MSYHSYSLDEPCGNTCPSIDGIIANINTAISILEGITQSEEPGTSSGAYDALDCLTGLESELEELRRNNSDLREWGKSLAGIIDNIRDIL